MENVRMNKDSLEFLKSNDGKFYCLLFSGLVIWCTYRYKEIGIEAMGVKVRLNGKFELTSPT